MSRVELIETLLAAVDRKIAESPNQPGLLELRAELAGQSSEYEQQVADYTAAIAALSERPSDEVAVDLARLYRRRGNVYVALKQWQPALDDYAKGITDETTDEDLLVNQALAQAEVLLDSLSVWKTLEPVEMKSEGGATLTLQEDGSILASGENPDRDVYTLVVRSELKQITGIMLEAIPDPSLPGNGSGRGITGNGNFHLNELRVFTADGAVTLTNAIASFQESNPQGDEAWHAIDGTVDARRGWSVNGRQSQPNTLTASLNLNRAVDDELKIELHFSTAKWTKHNLGRFRLSVTDNPEQVQDSQALQAARKLTDPWQKLAAAYRINDDQQAIDQLVERHPQTTGAIGDLFIAGEDKDWQRACEIYSKGITPESTDEELLAKRAKAYEELNDWNAAAADWSRVAKENPASAKLLADFASRLVSAGQNDLAAAQRQRARQILEVTLQVDPGDNLAVDRLAALLLESIEPKWTVLKSAEMKSPPGTNLTLEADQKMLTQRGNPDAKFESLVMQSGDALMRAVRVDETGRIPASADASSFFDEYQIAAIGSMSKDSGAMRGQYVRIDLPGKNDRYPRHPSHGDKKVLSLGEVEVFQGNENVAIAGNATQSTTDVGGVAKRAIDGNTNGNWSNNTTTHTAEETGVNGPWWEVDLGGEKEIDRLVIWNRPEIPERLRHFRIMILDASRNIVFEQFVVTPPQPSLEVSLTSIAAPPVGADTDSPGDLRLAVRLVGNRLNAMNIADSRLRLAAAYDLNSEAAASANWFDRALDEAETVKKREPILTQLARSPRAAGGTARTETG